MKKMLLRVLPVFAFVVFISSCSTKINTAAPYKSVTFVYSMLDMGDTAHYVRIQKAFLDANLSAYNMATVPDSSFYSTLKVVIREIDPSSKTIRSTDSLTKVDMALEGYPKDSGLFFTNTSYAYKFKKTLSASYTYRLVIYNPLTQLTDSSTTVILDESPNNFSVTLFDVQNRPLSLDTVRNGQFSIVGSAPFYSAFIQGVLRFHWVDRNVVTGAETDKYYDWDFASSSLAANTTSPNAFSLTALSSSFLSTLSEAMGPAPANVQRFLDSPDVYLYVGTPTLTTYLTVNQEAGYGITGGSIQPIYSDIAGSNVYGLYTTRGLKYKLSIPLDGQTFTYITRSPVMEGTGLQGTWADH